MSRSRIHQVTEASYAFLKKMPPDLVISATGMAATSGWTDPELGAWVYLTPPSDGVQDFDFIAKRPDGIVLQVLTPISAHTVLPDIDIGSYWGDGQPLTGFRIHALEGAVEVLFAKSTETSEASMI